MTVEQNKRIDFLTAPIETIDAVFGGKTAGIVVLDRLMQSTAFPPEHTQKIRLIPDVAVPVDWYNFFQERIVERSDGVTVICGYVEDLRRKDIQQLITDLPTGMYALRSSEPQEGPSGKNTTCFVVVDQNEIDDSVERVSGGLNRIYKDYEALHLCDDTLLGDEAKGIGVLVQPVVGEIFRSETGRGSEDFIAPLVSGVLTVDHSGKPSIRVSIGLGTKTVRVSEETLLISAEDLQNPDFVAQQLMQLYQMDAINVSVFEKIRTDFKQR